MTKKLDLRDPMVLMMARHNHVPEEAWSDDGQLEDVLCETCHNEWPCPTRIAIAVDGESLTAFRWGPDDTEYRVIEVPKGTPADFAFIDGRVFELTEMGDDDDAED